MNEKSAYIPIHELEVYRLSRRLSTNAWNVYQRLSFQEKKVLGDQMLSAVDSVGANIAGGMLDFIFLKNPDSITFQGHLYLKE